MKIGLVLSSLPAYSETFFRNKILGLQKNGHQVILFVGHSETQKDYLNCKVIKAPKLNGSKPTVIFNSFLQILKALVLHPKKSLNLYKLNQQDGIPFKKNIKQLIANQFLLSEQLDWLHFGFGTMALEKENIAKTIGAKMAVSFRGFDIGIYPIKHPDCYRFLFKKVDKIHVISDDLTKLLYQEGLPQRTVIIKITPAIDISFFVPNKQSENTVLQITTVARLNWKKGLEYTLESLSLLKKKNINFDYSIIGEGIEKERLKFCAYQLGILENVHFLGKLPPEKVKKQLSQTDIYLQYSIQEGFCNAVLEAQAMKLLCIVSDAEGLSENILDTQTGWVVPKRNSLLLAEKIYNVIQLTENEKNQIRKNAITRVQAEFNLQKQQKEFIDFYTK